MVRKSNILEKFFDERYIGGAFDDPNLDHANLQSNIYIEFYYKDTCAKSRQFLYGCCRPYSENEDGNKLDFSDNQYYSVEKKEPSMVNMESNSLYSYSENGAPMHSVTDEVQDARYDETHCYDHHGNKLNACFYKSKEDEPIVNNEVPFGRSENYHTGNSCMPINYFNFKDVNGADKHGCILQENLNGLKKPTFYYLKRFIDFVNFKYDEQVTNVLNGITDGTPITRFEVDKDGETDFRIYSSNKDFIKFHIHIKIISSDDISQTKGITLYPLLKLKFINKIDKSLEPPNDVKYTSYDYNGDVNNLCQVVDFLKEKVKLEYDDSFIDLPLY